MVIFYAAVALFLGELILPTAAAAVDAGIYDLKPKQTLLLHLLTLTDFMPKPQIFFSISGKL